MKTANKTLRCYGQVCRQPSVRRSSREPKVEAIILIQFSMFQIFTQRQDNGVINSNNSISLKSRTNKTNFLFAVTCCLYLLLFAGCGSTTYLSNGYGNKITTSVNSFGNYNMSGKTFYIESGDNKVSSNDVEFREYANYVANSLKCQGATETTDKRNADMCILVNYGISDESYTETVPIPIWGQTGISSISTTSTTTGSAYGNAYGSATRIGNSVYGSANSSVYGNSTTNTTTRVNPSYGVTGYTSVDRRVSMYCRILNIYGYDNKQTASANMLWKTNLSSCGNSSDLRNILPYMAYAAWGNMGKSSGGNEEYTTFLEDYYFRCWKQGVLFNDNLIGFPKYVSTNADNSMQIAIVEKLSAETIIVFRKSGCINWYSISPETYIEYNGHKYMLKNADGYELGKKIRNECGTRYLRLHFQAIPSGAKTVNISEGTKNGWFWNGVSIR